MTLILTMASESDIVVAADSLVVHGTDLGATRTYQGKLIKIPLTSWVIGGSGQGSIYGLIDNILAEIANHKLELDVSIEIAQITIATRMKELVANFGDPKRMTVLLAGLSLDGEPRVYCWQAGSIPERVASGTTAIGSSSTTALDLLTEFLPLVGSDIERRIRLAEFVCYSISRFDPMVGGKTGIWLVSKTGIQDMSGDQDTAKSRTKNLWSEFSAQMTKSFQT